MYDINSVPIIIRREIEALIVAVANGSPQTRKLDTTARKILRHMLSDLKR